MTENCPAPIWVLLPGMDGTGALFEPLLEALPEGQRCQVLRYPLDEKLDYGELESLTEQQLPKQDFLLVAESFSGPLAIRLSAKRPARLKALVLVATFARPPIFFAPLLRRLAPLVMALPAPHFFLRWCLMNGGEERLSIRLRESVGLVSNAVMGHRLRSILTCEVSALWQTLELPTLILAARRDRLVSARSWPLI